MEGLRRYGYDRDCLNNVLPDQFGRPFIDNRVDFNISHSDGYVVCSLIEGGRVGIDIEKIKPVDLSDFENVMTPDEIKVIKESDGFRKFYEYWTIKESVLKASGRGLIIPFRDVVIDGKKATLYDRDWFLTNIDIDTEYVCHLATDREHTGTRLDEIEF